MKTRASAIFIFLFLFSSISFAQATVCIPSFYYGSFLSTAAIGFFALIALIALAYMAGEFFSHPKLLVWSRDEISQVLYSALILVLVSQILLSFCSISVGGAVQLTSASLSPSSPLSSSQNVFQAAEATLSYLQSTSYSSFSAIRSRMGQIEKDLVYYEWESTFFGLLGGGGVSSSPHSGEQAMLGALGMFMNASMISLLTVISQISLYKFMLAGDAFNNSFLPFFLVCGVILRSIPFMRGLGGALLGFAIVLCIFFPLLLLIEGLVWPPVYDTMTTTNTLVVCSCPSIPAFGCSIIPPPITHPGSCTDAEHDDCNCNTTGADASLIQQSSLSFLGGVFFSSLNFILIIAAIGQVSSLLGQEVDASRLARLI